MAATLAELDRVEMERPVLIGHSAGAEIAYALAAHQPERVRALVLLGPVLGGGPPPFVGWFARLPGTALVAPALLRASMRAFGPALRMAWFDRSLVTAEVIEGYKRPLLEPGIAESLWTMTQRRSPATRPTAPDDEDLPCLVITGDHDRWASPVPLPGAQKVIVERCGHLPHEEHPELVAGKILEFVGSLSA